MEFHEFKVRLAIEIIGLGYLLIFFLRERRLSDAELLFFRAAWPAVRAKGTQGNSWCGRHDFAQSAADLRMVNYERAVYLFRRSSRVDKAIRKRDGG